MIILKINMTANQNFYSKTVIVEFIKYKTEDVNEDFSSYKKVFDVSNHSTKSKCLSFKQISQ